jgi:hypothetical protein
MSAHLPLHRLDPGTTLDPDERAHLEQCPRCRVEARMLSAALEEDPAGTPGLEQARATLDQVRTRTLGTLTTGVNSLSHAFGVIAAPPEHPAEMPGVDTQRFQAVRWVETGPLGPVYEVEDMDTGRRLALRVLQGADEETVARIGHYIDRLATTRIAGVAPPVELRAVGDHWTVATPWVSGQPLHAVLHGDTDPLRPQPADEGDLPRVLVAVQQVAAALSPPRMSSSPCSVEQCSSIRVCGARNPPSAPRRPGSPTLLPSASPERSRPRLVTGTGWGRCCTTP